MTIASQGVASSPPDICVDVVEDENDSLQGWVRCAIKENFLFDVSTMESFFFAKWEPVLYDAFVVAAAVEFCDITKRRSSQDWGRCIVLRIPVHDLGLWSKSPVTNSLRDALGFLTGDCWDLRFYQREKKADLPRQGQFNLRRKISAVIPFSDGLDSCVAAGLTAQDMGDRVVRVRLGTRKLLPNRSDPRAEPFTAMPYSARKGKGRYDELSSRSRGFKFALVSGIAAFLSGAEKVIVPEGGQGALGPSLVPVGQAYPDYRSHPRFGRKMEDFLRSLVGFEGQYDYPYIWNTKGETLTRFIEQISGDNSWGETRSCWQPNRQVSVEGRSRQCGICAACMLRRLSVHTAGQKEPSDTYVWENLAMPTFESGATPKFGEIKRAMREHAIAGTLHMDHLASLLQSQIHKPRVKLEIFHLSQALELRQDVVKQKLERLLAKHKKEWEDFMMSLGAKSFIAGWAEVRGYERT